MMSGSKIVLPSSDADEYTLHALRSTIISIVNPKGRKGRNIYISGNRPSWWPKDVAFSSVRGSKAIANSITVGNMRNVLSSTHLREVSPQSSFESDQEEPVGMNQTPPTGANRTRSVGATISTAAQHASPKLILPSSCANDYSPPDLISLIQKILNPQRRNFVYSSANRPSWWPTDVTFIRAEGKNWRNKERRNGMKAKDRIKVLTAFLKKCPEQYTISPPVDQRNSALEDKTDQPEDSIIYIDDSSNESDSSDPEDLLNSLEQHLLDSRKRRLEAERKVEKLSEENKRLKKEKKFIGSIVKRSRLHHY